MKVKPGQRVVNRQEVAVVNDPFGRKVSTSLARQPGVVIGVTLNPLATQGDALVHVGIDPAAALPSRPTL
jgi:predicted deacylase